jgi:hypothetical protein
MAKKTSKKVEKIDGLGPEDIKKIRAAIRQVWAWSHPRRLVVKRCEIAGGFSKCEQCKKKCAKIFVDHIKVMGDLLAPDYILRMWTPSKNLQGLCKKCHDDKTKDERKLQRQIEKDAEAELDFY